MADHDRNLSAELVRSVADLQDQEVVRLVNERIALGEDPLDIVEDCRQGMIEVGKRYEQRQYYLAGLILAGEILREVMEIIQPLTDKKYLGHTKGCALVGTVEGDIHDAGKDLFKILLSVHGFTVHDLGVNVPPADFVSTAAEIHPTVVGLSCLLINAYTSMKETIQQMRADPRTAAVPVIIGGQVSADVCKFVGADYWSTDAMDGVHWCLDQLEKQSNHSK
jgi:methanogenic corrinoid protein MtbC1